MTLSILMLPLCHYTTNPLDIAQYCRHTTPFPISKLSLAEHYTDRQMGLQISDKNNKLYQRLMPLWPAD
jgi:hypothetical protein